MEVVPGIHRVDGAIGCNVYLLVGDELTLVDTGLPGNRGAILRYIRHLHRDPAELSRVIFTHGHPDHTGTANALRRRTGARLLVHGGDARRDGDGGWRVHYVSQPFAFPWEVPFMQRVPADGILEEGTLIPVFGGLRVFHTPGHTAGSVCLYLEQHGVLFTGDTLLGSGKTYSRPMPLPGYDADLYQHSLACLGELEFEVACGGHGRPLVGRASRMLGEMMQAGALDSYWDNLRHRLMVSLGAR